MKRKKLRLVVVYLLCEFVGDLALLFPRLPILLVRLVERIHELFVTQKPEPAEGVNLVLALSFIAPLAFNPNYLQTSPYLQQIGARFTNRECLFAFVVLFIYWGFCSAFGGTPSAFISKNRHVVNWLALRCFGLLMATFVWLCAAQILSLEGFGGGTVIYGFGAIWSTGALLVLGWNIIVEKERYWRKQGESGDTSQRSWLIKRRATANTIDSAGR